MINLDFVAPRPRAGEYALVAVAALAVIGVTVAGFNARAAVQSAEARLQQISISTSRAADHRSGLVPAALPVQVSKALTTPWSALLSDLEAQARSAGDDVALLRIEPDRAHETLRLVAETRTLASALGYVERLQSLRSLSEAVLLSHELQKDDPQRPIRVEIAARWGQGS